MRTGFALTLLVSLALHTMIGVGFGVAWLHARHSAEFGETSFLSKTSSLVWIKPQDTSTPELTDGGSASSQIAPIISSTLPIPSKRSLANAIAPRVKPNLTMREPSPEEILSPLSAPVLDSHAGIVFVLDVSGSMYEPYAGSTRLMLARESLARRIRALPNGTPFAVTIYAEQARVSGPLVAASETTREAAVRFIAKDFDFGGGTNLPRGLALAEALHPGSLVVVTDGDLNMEPAELLNHTRNILAGDRPPGLSIVAIAPRDKTEAEPELRSLAAQQEGKLVVESVDSEGKLLTVLR